MQRARNHTANGSVTLHWPEKEQLQLLLEIAQEESLSFLYNGIKDIRCPSYASRKTTTVQLCLMGLEPKFPSFFMNLLQKNVVMLMQCFFFFFREVKNPG